MGEKIFDLILSYPLILIVLIVLIPVVHFLKKIIKDDNKDMRSLKVIGLSFATSFVLNLLPAFAYQSISAWLDFIIFEIALTLIMPVIAGGITVIFDIAIKAGLLDSAIEWLKNFLNKKGGT
ncbi:MAG: hypothetical protein WC389_03680 [Lutibacter sp.]|jgi:glucan phosphoethanolaminetransferase (alkaline phosphatase superfamily)